MTKEKAAVTDERNRFRTKTDDNNNKTALVWRRLISKTGVDEGPSESTEHTAGL